MTNNKITSVRVTMPDWLRVLDIDHAVIAHAIEGVKKHCNKPEKAFKASEFFQRMETAETDAERGVVTYSLVPHEDLYWRVLSEMAGVAIANEMQLMAYVAKASETKREYDKLSTALSQVEQSGYGVVVPTWQSFSLEQPQLHRSGKNFGVKLRASGTSLHIVRVDVKSEVAPIIGSQQQSEEMLRFLQSEYQNNRQTVWETPIFGKSLESIVREDISNKSVSMPAMAQGKMRTALTKIVNNGKGGVICILL